MAESKSSIQIPEQVKEMVEKAIEQAEQGVYRLIEAADKLASVVPNPTTDFSKKLLSMGAQNMNAAFDHARNLLRCSDLQEAANLQAQFLNAQFETASRQLKELYDTPGSDVETSKKSIEIK
ncbi:phasin family protein [Bradyrhizobium sp. JYMT SZCCT0428]|uniref:phasin family protein n=1 Tax=Bradyrhizobium sp. JYMT SZCCT0428 TaxID=2807673 RepID=UPI001BAC75EE|nr:phasin family protein [Bradyrhizobium sp. JYMT SZCCT0428]MBR1153841.1 phasin family protein [Bradyrhizobium sp. JYMT SZCCT0428]